MEYNAANSVCSSCHSDTNAPATGNELMILNTAGSTHVNTQPDVVFASLSGFKSKAQLRDDITTVPELDTSWTRTNGYKGAGGTSYDTAKTAGPTYNTGTLSCSTVDCHNGNAATWTDSNVNCMYCHTSMPQ